MLSKGRIYIVVVWLAVIAAVCSASAQTRVNSTGNGGIHIIQGQIYNPNGGSPDGQITVRLESLSSYTELSLMTDRNGGFGFRALTPGTYTVVVNAGEEYEIARETITIDPEITGANMNLPPTPKVVTIPIYLRPKRRERDPATVVNAKLASVPKDALKHYEKGLELAAKNRPDDAAAAFRKAIAIYPSLTLAYVELGKLDLKANRLDEAITAFRTALKYEPGNFDATVNYGVALYAKKDLQAAEPVLLEAAKYNSSAVTPHYYLGLVFLQEKDLDAAQKEFETAKGLMGEKALPLVHRYLGGIYLAKDQEKLALEELEAYVKLDPNGKDSERIRQTISELKSKMKGS
ncbi:hypothetical protein BH10ACI3_BH10ACI3_03570 [soil metagenome]